MYKRIDKKFKEDQFTLRNNGRFVQAPIFTASAHPVESWILSPPRHFRLSRLTDRAAAAAGSAGCIDWARPAMRTKRRSTKATTKPTTTRPAAAAVAVVAAAAAETVVAAAAATAGAGGGAGRRWMSSRPRAASGGDGGDGGGGGDGGAGRSGPDCR